jgi:hypothetical protein
MLGSPLISVSGYCFGPLSLVRVLRYDWTAKSLTWNIVVSPSGGGKSQAFAKVQKAVLAFEERVIAELKEKVLKYLEEGEISEGSEEYDEAWKKAGFVRVSVEGAISDCLSQKLHFFQLYGSDSQEPDAAALWQSQCLSLPCFAYQNVSFLLQAVSQLSADVPGHIRAAIQHPARLPRPLWPATSQRGAAVLRDPRVLQEETRRPDHRSETEERKKMVQGNCQQE